MLFLISIVIWLIIFKLLKNFHLIILLFLLLVISVALGLEKLNLEKQLSQVLFSFLLVFCISQLIKKV